MRKSNSQSSDERIDQALALLHQAQSPEGFETRVLASLRHRKPLPPATRPFHRRWLSAALTLASVFAALVVGLLFRPSISPVNPVPAASPTPNPITLPATISSFPPSTRRRHASRSKTPPSPGSVLITSFPAPPAPLTAQEKLLLQIAHRGDQEDYHLLNPETAARELAQNMADVDRFFPPPPPFGPPNPRSKSHSEPGDSQ